MVRIVPRNDPESAVLAYMEREKPLKSVLQGYANRNARKTMQKVTALLERMGYDGKNANTVLIRQADPRTIRDLEEIAERLPAKERRQVLAKLYGQIGTGTLTVKRAVNDLLRYGPLQDADQMYADAKGVLRKTASEGMLRGEFMVQKSLGVGWQTETPNIKGVDAFLHKRWDERDATDYLKPMGQVMKDQVTESIFLGESPQKMSQRMQRVEDISKVRADRNARTITTAVANEAQMDSYKKDGVKQYQWVATFDERTCPACGAKDGKKYPMGNGDYPPLHPNCRCTTIAVLSKAIQDRLNANLALHKDDYKAKYVSPDTTYQEWKDRNVTNKPTKNPLKEPTKKERTAFKAKDMTVESYPPAFSRTKQEAKNTQMVADYVNGVEKADQNVKNLYANMGKMENIESQGKEFKITHGRDSGVVNYRYNGATGNLVDAKIAYPKMESPDDVGAVQTTLHEQMHLMDMYSREDPAKPGRWFSSSRPELVETFQNTSKDIGQESSELFTRYHEEMEAERIRLAKIRDEKTAELHRQYDEGEIDRKTYEKGWKQAWKDYNTDSDDYNRAWDGGGAGLLEDIYDALSGGEYRDKGVVKYGHGRSYYRDKESRIHEALANYGSLSVTRPDLIDMLRKDKPELCKALDDTIDAMNDKWGLKS